MNENDFWIRFNALAVIVLLALFGLVFMCVYQTEKQETERVHLYITNGYCSGPGQNTWVKCEVKK